jgi:predicted Fe-Mo cluster-binding NifX family protein
MKLAITSLNKNISSEFSPRFSRCKNFILVDTETREWEALTNPAADSPGGAGPMAVQFIAGQGVEAVISGRFGPSAYTALETAGIQMLISSSGTVKEALEEFLAGKIEQVSSATGPELHSKGRHK